MSRSMLLEEELHITVLAKHVLKTHSAALTAFTF